MSNGNRPPVWQMVREATEALGEEMTYHAIKSKVRALYGDDINGSSITCSIISGSVNHRSRIHYGENKKPRIADTPYDYLYNTGHGRAVRYQPEIHGVWEIAQSADGNLIVRMAEGEGDSPIVAISEVEAADDAYGMFALEAHLRDYLAKNLPKLPGHDRPLSLYRTDDRDGVEYQTDVGPIDILSTLDGDFYVLELKLGRGPDAALGQILRYMGWVQQHLAGDNKVYGIIVASDISPKLRYAATQVPNVRLMEYSLSVSLRPVSLHEQ